MKIACLVFEVKTALHHHSVHPLKFVPKEDGAYYYATDVLPRIQIFISNKKHHCLELQIIILRVLAIRSFTSLLLERIVLNKNCPLVNRMKVHFRTYFFVKCNLHPLQFINSNFVTSLFCIVIGQFDQWRVSIL